MRLFVVQSPAVIIRDLRIDGDAHVHAVLHQTVRSAHLDLETDLLHKLLIFGFRELLNEFSHGLRIPSGIGAGLRQKLGIVCVQAQHFLREIRLGKVEDLEFDALLFALVVQVYLQLLPGGQFDLRGFAGERIGPVHPDVAADAVQRLLVSPLLNDVIRIPPRRFTLYVARVALDMRFRNCQRLAVIDLFAAAGPEGERGGVDGQQTVHLLDVGEVAGDILSGLVVDHIAAHRIGARAGIGLTAVGDDTDAEFVGKTIDQDVRRAREGLAVIQLAGALGHERDRFRPCPVPIRGKGIRHAQDAAYGGDVCEVGSYVVAFGVKDRIGSDDVFALADRSLFAAGGGFEAETVGKVLGGDFAIGQGRAVIGAADRGGGEGDL